MTPKPTTYRWVLGLAAATLLVAGPVRAQSPDGAYTHLTIDVPAPSGARADLQDRARSELTDRVVERMETRLDVAGIDYASFETPKTGLVRVEVNSDVDRRLLAGLLLPPGEVAIRPVRWVGARWMELLSSMPEGIRLRQASGSLATDRAYLWSRNRETLADFAARASFPEGNVHTYPHDGGWRSLVLGAPVVGTPHVEGADIRAVPNGTPFVSVDLAAEAVEALESDEAENDPRWAVVLDGEVVAMFDDPAFEDGALHVMAPTHLDGGEEQSNWARQVGARLAASIPVKLVLVD